MNQCPKFITANVITFLLKQNPSQENLETWICNIDTLASMRKKALTS